ncbi:MAG TPA: 1,4-alpha-glucan branching protein domain-containing protein [Acidimicrobiia bacterium]
MSAPVGRLAIVLHSHVPWLLGHGVWPVGEEWLRQAWAHSYIPVLSLLRERAEQGRRDLVTLGITPVLAAQWDEPSSVAEQERWIADWRERATGKALEAHARGDSTSVADAHRHFQRAQWTLQEFTGHWRAGGSAALRPLVDAGAIELLSGPVTHTFTPHLLEPVADLAIRTGLAETTVRTGSQPSGIWAPECAYSPGLEDHYQRHAITHFLVDGPTLLAAQESVHRPYHVGSSNVVAFARDLELTYRVWSPRSGYPGNRWYQDFHTYDHDWGLHSSRVTRQSSDRKQPYEPARAAQQVRIDAEDFLRSAQQRMIDSPEEDPVVVVAYDTELFGHWWHEGPSFLAAVLDQAACYGIELTTLTANLERAQSRAQLSAGTWGSGKDARVWESGEAGELRDRGRAAQYALVRYIHELPPGWRFSRHRTADAIATELLLALSSDWAFMITKDSAADYARSRATEHFVRFGELLRAAHHDPMLQITDDRLPFLDARRIPT